jgi:hypothetical protein
MERRLLDVDGGANGVIFHKWGENDWGYRRRSFTRGWLFTVVFPGLREREPDHALRGPLSLIELMDYIHRDGPKWVEWKRDHPEVFAASSAT